MIVVVFVVRKRQHLLQPSCLVLALFLFFVLFNVLLDVTDVVVCRCDCCLSLFVIVVVLAVVGVCRSGFIF